MGKREVRIQRESDRARGTHILKGAEGEVRTQKESEQVRGTHALKSADRGNNSGHAQEGNQQGVLTNWRARKRDVRT